MDNIKNSLDNIQNIEQKENKENKKTKIDNFYNPQKKIEEIKAKENLTEYLKENLTVDIIKNFNKLKENNQYAQIEKLYLYHLESFF
jgi:precorrin-3B methylase